MDKYVTQKYIPKMLRQHPCTTGDRSQVRITEWIVRGVTVRKGTPAEEVMIKSHYRLEGGYRYCHNIGRHHKSNGVKLEINLSQDHATRGLQQTCWDPECKTPEGRSFKQWPGEAVPYEYYTPKSDLDEYIQEYLEKNIDFAALEAAAGTGAKTGG